MKFLKIIFKALIALIVIALIVVLVVPYLIPFSEPEGRVDPKALADADSQFVEVKGISIHFKQHGESASDFILLHGLGASVFSWRQVIGPLSEYGTVTVYDRPAFGLTERVLPEEYNGQNPYLREFQPELLDAFMEELGLKSAVLIGNSAGGTVAAQMALRYPERVDALILVDPALLTLGGPPSVLNTIFRLPSIDRVGPFLVGMLADRAGGFLERAFHDPSKITKAMVAGYEEPLKVEHWERAFWEFIKAADYINLPERLDEINVPVLIITGDDDRIIPTEESIRAAAIIPGAKLVVIPKCGHVPQEECPNDFLNAVEEFFRDMELPDNNG